MTLALGIASAAPKGPVIPKYTVIPVVLDDTVSSKTNHVGDRFEGHCTGPDCGGFPVNTTFQGVITVAEPSQSGQPGVLAGRIVAAVLPDGTKINIEAAPCEKDGTKKEPIVGTTAKKGRGKKGAVVGGALGGIFGGDIEGAAIGAVAGVAAGNATKGKTKNVERKAGFKAYIVLTAPATLP